MLVCSAVGARVSSHDVDESGRSTPQQQGKCLFHHEDAQDHEENLCLREAVLQLRKLRQRSKVLLEVQMQEVLGHEVEDICDRGSDDEHARSYTMEETEAALTFQRNQKTT